MLSLKKETNVMDSSPEVSQHPPTSFQLIRKMVIDFVLMEGGQCWEGRETGMLVNARLHLRLLASALF